MNRTARLFGRVGAGHDGLDEQFAKKHARKPAPQSQALVIDPDGIWRSLKQTLTDAKGLQITWQLDED